ncbi:neutral zinc metallopeptidase [Streptomyces sp. NPDC088748]|uniref:neutral zinc metallopeptidase n=1 Tax=Streptomyces sp. NPDC088748 TaxID=3365887 RepID=UPI00382E3E0C
MDETVGGSVLLVHLSPTNSFLRSMEGSIHAIDGAYDPVLEILTLRRKVMARACWIRVWMILATALVLLSSGGNIYEETSFGISSFPARSDDTIEQDIDAAVSGVDAYWKNHWQEFFTGAYGSPTVYGGYDGAAVEPQCGGRPPLANNAFYCGGGADFLAWDTHLMENGYAAGDVYVYFIIAHEWGHAVQERLDVTLRDVALELQADCLAGAELNGAAQDGTISFEEGDANELGQAIKSTADDFPWNKSTDHGDVDQRISHFNAGWQGGISACLPQTFFSP